MAKKTDLDKGLKALLGNIESKNVQERQEVIRELSHSTAMIPIDDIEFNPFQPRKYFSDSELEELASSIKALGLIQPVTVRSLGGQKYQIISGERRWRASKLAGLTEIPAYVRLADDQAMMEMALVENIQRSDLNSLEIAVAYNRLLEEFSLTHESVAERVGKNRSTITNYLRLLKLPPTIQQGIKEDLISMGHAKVLAGIDNLPLQLSLYHETVKNNLSVRALEKKVLDHLSASTRSKSDKTEGSQDPAVSSLQNKLVDHFETRVAIKRNDKGAGFIQIFFDTDDDFNEILDKMDI
ncbi:MAG TPA: ParB/RepB/Spo0J family partition protein [Saprospiraceae bacterium]|nr:chromosome partitioning protein ParB [Saprospirales bacterium]HRQ29407.1 ParB/RepB/Spo0J family partition protein [Saprospiraceae bacterium]